MSAAATAFMKGDETYEGKHEKDRKKTRDEKAMHVRTQIVYDGFAFFRSIFLFFLLRLCCLGLPLKWNMLQNAMFSMLEWYIKGIVMTEPLSEICEKMEENACFFCHLWAWARNRCAAKVVVMLHKSVTSQTHKSIKHKKINMSASQYLAFGKENNQMNFTFRWAADLNIVLFGSASSCRYILLMVNTQKTSFIIIGIPPALVLLF